MSHWRHAGALASRGYEGERDDYLLVRIEPPIIGQRYGLGGRDIDCVLLATRHEGASLFPIREWPVFVHIARLRIEHPEDRDEVNDDELSSIMWGELYPTEEDAEGGLESFMRGPRNRTGDSPRGIWKVLRRALGF